LWIGRWTETLDRFVPKLLLEPLAAILRDASWPPAERDVAANLLADYAADRPALVVACVLDAEPRQAAVLLRALKSCPQRAAPILEKRFAEKPSPQASAEERDLLLKRQAHAAIALLQLGRSDFVWPLLRRRDDPTVRTYLIHRLG